MGKTRLALIAAALVLLPLTAACAAGQRAQTREQVSVQAGSTGQVGDLRIAAALAVYPPNGVYPSGSTVPIYFTVVNPGTTADTLRGATSPAGQVRIVGSFTPPATPSPVPSGSPAAGTGTTVALPPGSLRTVSLQLSGTRQALRSGANFALTLQFDTAGPVTLRIPVALATDPGYAPSPAATPSPSPSGSASG